MRSATRLSAVEFTTPVPHDDAELLAGLGFVARSASGGAGVELRTCADPYGCRVVLRPGPRVALRRLSWRVPDATHLDAAAEAVRAGRDVADLVRTGGWVGDALHVGHPDGSDTVLHWREDREWAAGPALSCPLHPDGSTRLCAPDPPLVDGVAVSAPAGVLARWEAGVLGALEGPRVVPGEGPGLLLRSALVRSSAVTTTPGGLVLRLTPDRTTATLESEHVF